jgi:antitoxin VapB
MIFAYTLAESNMATAALFDNNKNQAVRLPNEFRFPEGVKRVNIRRQGKSLVITPVGWGWDAYFRNAEPASDDFMVDRDLSPPQEREPFDD